MNQITNRDIVERSKAYRWVSEKAEFLRRRGSGGHICVRVSEAVGELAIAPEWVREALEAFADFGILSMSTWRRDVWREVNWREWHNEDFFYNRDDSNYVHLRLA
jgi:hypothetical protein